ncbi:YIP1 family protein [Coprobacillus sp. AF21-8LB]|nr:YIP1 family protein [Coprobacillus sp. AF21-8LB]
MELHIKEFEYQNIIKQQMYKQLATLSLYVLLLAFALESILYDFDYAWIILFVAAMAVINLNFRKKKKLLGYDLVYIDEENRFFYNNTFIEMKDLQNYVVSKETITLNFIDYSIVIEKDEKLYDYLNQFAKNTKPINVKKTKLFIFCMAILVMFFSLSLGNLVLGSIYSYVNHVEMVSFSTILIPVIQITSILLGVALIFFVAKKFKKGIGLYVSLLLIVFYIALPFIGGNDIHRLDNGRVYTRQDQKLTLYSRYKKGYGKLERQIKNVSNKAEVGNYQSILYILENQKIEVISLEKEDQNDQLLLKINNQTYMGTYISTEYSLSFENNEVYFKKNYSSEVLKLKRINNHMLYFKYNNNYYFIYILEKQNAIRLYDLSNERDLILRLASNPLEQFKSQTDDEDTSKESQNQTEQTNQEESMTTNNITNENQTTTNEDDPERVYFEKVYDLLIAQNKLESPCFDYQLNAKGYPYAVVSTNDEYTLSLVFNKYKNNDEDYEIVLEKYIKKTSTQSLVDFYLVNTKTLEVTDQQRDYW